MYLIILAPLSRAPCLVQCRHILEHFGYDFVDLGYTPKYANNLGREFSYLVKNINTQIIVFKSILFSRLISEFTIPSSGQ